MDDLIKEFGLKRVELVQSQFSQFKGIDLEITLDAWKEESLLMLEHPNDLNGIYRYTLFRLFGSYFDEKYK